MKKPTKKFLTVLLAAVFLASSALMLRQRLADQASEDTYEEARQMASAPKKQPEPALPAAPVPTEPEKPAAIYWMVAPVEEEDPHMEELAALDLEALRQTNEDVVGWIRIPGTKLDYPLLQGEDNSFYLYHGWDGRYREAGSIFLESQNSRDMTDFNTIVYGHNMNAGTMFGSLRKYRDQSYYEEHPYVYLLTDQGVWRYEIFSAYHAPIDSVTYALSFPQQEDREVLIATALENSQLDTGIVPLTTDRILTLSTCSTIGYKSRWVVQGRLAMVEVTEE